MDHRPTVQGWENSAHTHTHLWGRVSFFLFSTEMGTSVSAVYTCVCDFNPLNWGPFRTQYTLNVFLIHQLPTLPIPLYTNLNFTYCVGANLRNCIDYINGFKYR